MSAGRETNRATPGAQPRRVRGGAAAVFGGRSGRVFERTKSFGVGQSIQEEPVLLRPLTVSGELSQDCWLLLCNSEMDEI